jgi:hypothetical protein
MRLSGHFQPESSCELCEVILSASDLELRAIAKFLTHCADEMERMGTSYDHIHLADFLKEFSESPHLVVARA